MPKQHARKKAIRQVAAEYDLSYSDATALYDSDDYEALVNILDSYYDINTYREAADHLAVMRSDPGLTIMCFACGWLWAQVCPECEKGCGCDDSGCTGWRHEEMRHLTGSGDDDEDYDPWGCQECGAGSSNDPYGECVCGDWEQDDDERKGQAA